MAVLLGSKNLSVIEEVVLTSSQTYTARRTGIADVICIGAGGQGGSSGKAAASFGGMVVNATGGGAGGYSRKRIPITAGDTFTVVVGAGGQANPSTLMPDADGLKDGGAGGETTFDHASATANIALDSNGGAGGVGNQTSTASGATYAGGAGGTATGGDVNFTGGRGGTITRNNTSSGNGMFATGGGAVAILGGGFNGGDINFTGTNYKHSATGGAGIGGDGGSVAYNANAQQSTTATSGGSASGEGNGLTADQTTSVSNGEGLTAAAKTDVVMGGGRLPSHGGNGFATNSMVYCVAGNGGTGAMRAILAGHGDSGYHSVYGGNEKPTEVHDAAALHPTGSIDGLEASYPQPTGPGGGGGGAAGNAYNNASNSVIAAGNGAAFAGGGGACSVVSNSEIAHIHEAISSSGRGGIGGGGSGGCILGTNAANSTNEWASGGDGVVIIQYLG